jgi:hypothetical protein
MRIVAAQFDDIKPQNSKNKMRWKWIYANAVTCRPR